MKGHKSTVIVTCGSAQSVGFYQGDNADERKGIYISDYDTRSDDGAGMLIRNETCSGSE